MQDLSGAAVAGAHLLSLVLMGASRKVFGPEVVAQRLVRHRHRHPRHHPLHKPPSLSFATASLTATLTASLTATLATTLAATLATLNATLAATIATTLAAALSTAASPASTGASPWRHRGRRHLQHRRRRPRATRPARHQVGTGRQQPPGGRGARAARLPRQHRGTRRSMVKVPWLTAADAATHHWKPSRLPSGREENPRRLGAEESLRWRSDAWPKSPILLPLTI